jgi:hypothetical protein
LLSDTARAIKEADCGIVVESENDETFIEAMRIVAIDWDKEVRLQKGERGFQYAMRRFSKKQNLSKVINVICTSTKLH